MTSGKATGLLELGTLMADAGYPVPDVQAVLRAAAAAQGRPDIVVSALGDQLIVDDPMDNCTRTALTSGRVLNYGQTRATTQLSAAASHGNVPLESLSDEVKRALAAGTNPPRWAIMLGCGLVSLGLGIAFDAPYWAIGISFFLGFISSAGMGAIKLTKRVASIMPLVLSFITTLLLLAVAALIQAHTIPLVALAVPVVILVPGAVITQAVLEISGGDPISGGGRLVAGLLTWGLMAGGVLLAVAVFGGRPSGYYVILPWGSELTTRALGWWATAPPAWTGWLGMLGLGIGFALLVWFPWKPALLMLAVLEIAYTILTVCSPLMGSPIATGIAAAAALFISRSVERYSPALPPLILFRPTFWALVPGTLGLVGILSSSGHVDTGDVAMPVMGTILAIAVGLQVGALASELVHPHVRHLIPKKLRPNVTNPQAPTVL
ncbi:MAG: threonine/serine exporter family protein [Propionibacteriaceae bacterium]|nr:threonine/serine exporter family protein [Propionibacteriaceae bacterium]